MLNGKTIKDTIKTDDSLVIIFTDDTSLLVSAHADGVFTNSEQLMPTFYKKPKLGMSEMNIKLEKKQA